MPSLRNEVYGNLILLMEQHVINTMLYIINTSTILQRKLNTVKKQPQVRIVQINKLEVYELTRRNIEIKKIIIITDIW